MANWKKLNKEFDDALDSMTSEDWELLASKRIKQTTRTMKEETQLTAVEWLMTKLQSLGVTKEEHYELLCQLELEAKIMEDQQKVEFALRAYIEKLSPGKDFVEIVNSMRTFKQQEQ